MILDRVTLTGADDSADPAELLKLSEEFPFVEWGILFGSKARPRYPSSGWLWKLREAIDPRHVPLPKLSAHLCSSWVRSLVCEGEFTWTKAYEFIAPLFQRVQLNFHGQYHKAHEKLVDVLNRNCGYEFIFQHDGVNDEQIERLVKTPGGASRTILFDRSGGAGVLPDYWPAPIGRYFGYAGGLGPENVKTQLALIQEAVGTAARLIPNLRAGEDSRIWIDMETRVRSADDAQFDLAKCRAVLETAKTFITPPYTPLGPIRDCVH